MIDIIIPTLWLPKDFLNALKKYIDNTLINKIIIIDNDQNNRPKSELLVNPKVELISYGRNIFVNPAWNEGYLKSKSDIIAIINDDITVEDSIFEMVKSFGIEDGDLIGVNLRGYENNFKIDDFIDTKEEIVKLNYVNTKPIGSQAWAFGICMFMLRKSYNIIPSLYQVWYGDDYLAQRAKNVYAINSNKIKGKISESLKSMHDPDSEISKRVELDSKNLIRFGHFKNSENWDIPNNIIRNNENKRKIKNVFESEYEKAKTQKSDINENVHILYDLAQECKHVTEMGVRTGVSTRALLNSNVELVSYDIELNRNVSDLFKFAINVGKKVSYKKANVLDIEIEETDLLFIDTLHTYEQLKQELKLHGNKARKYLAFHDTFTFGLKGEIGGNNGLLSAIIEFLIENPHWRFKIYKTNNNGFTVLERVN